MFLSHLFVILLRFRECEVRVFGAANSTKPLSPGRAESGRSSRSKLQPGWQFSEGRNSPSIARGGKDLLGGGGCEKDWQSPLHRPVSTEIRQTRLLEDAIFSPRPTKILPRNFASRPDVTSRCAPASARSVLQSSTLT